MNMADIRRKAKNFGLKVQGLKKVNLIRAIQTAEGNTACFATGRETCDQLACCWRADCLPVKMEEHK